MSASQQRLIRFKRAYVFFSASLFLVATFQFGRAAEAEDDAAKHSNVAKQVINRSGVQKGICAVLGDSADVALELAKSSKWLVHAYLPDAEQAARLKKQVSDAGFGIDRLIVERGSLEQLPYADNMIDVVVADGQSVSIKEIMRVLRPGGTAFLSAKAGQGNQLRKSVKPPLDGAGDWSHWEHGPDNNPVSEDQIIKAPYMTQFLAKPYYIAMPSVTTAAGGRTFLAIGHIAHHQREWGGMNKIIARNGYNGTILWERKLPAGYMVHRSAFIATKDTFYMNNGDHCLMLDPETGAEKGKIQVADVPGHWKWMVMSDGVLYALVGAKDRNVQVMKGDRSFGGWSWADLSRGYYGRRVPWGFGKTLVAIDLSNKEQLWKHVEKEKIDSRSLSMGKGKLLLYCPDHHLRCLDTKTGDIVWTNAKAETLKLIEQPGKGLTSTPGFRSACLAVHTPDAFIIQGQTRQNVVAISTADGYHLWSKKKITNNPNAIYVDGKLILGVGKNGSHVAIEPSTGNVLEDLGFRKTACTRLTASSDSFFVRGEGTLRYDRDSKKVLIDGSIRPACNDGALPANGLLYLGPWQCDCNLSLIGRMAKCSAGDFEFDHVATAAEHFEKFVDDIAKIAPLEISENDWPTLRRDNDRSASTSQDVASKVTRRWDSIPNQDFTPAPPVSAGGLLFITGNDGKVRALNSKSGDVEWSFSTAGPIKMPPTIADNRLYVGSSDGYVYTLEAATGRLLWRFRAAPVERRIMVYGSMSSTWPVNTGVLVKDGIAYFAAGIIDHDGTYVYAVDAKTGKIKWQNNSSGHLNSELRKGVSAQGNLTIHGNRLLFAGGNQVSPAPFDLETGECLAKPFDQGRPKANNGQFAGVLLNDFPIIGGRVLYSAPSNVSTKGSFVTFVKNQPLRLNFGGIPAAWSETTVALVNFKHGKLTCCDADKVAERLSKGYDKDPKTGRRRRTNLATAFARDKAIRWQSDLGESNKFEAVSLAICPNAVVAIVQNQQKARAQPQWYAVAFNAKNGATLWRHELRNDPLPGGLLIDRNGQVIVTMLDGSVLCLGQSS